MIGTAPGMPGTGVRRSVPGRASCARRRAAAAAPAQIRATTSGAARSARNRDAVASSGAACGAPGGGVGAFGNASGEFWTIQPCEIRVASGSTWVVAVESPP